MPRVGVLLAVVGTALAVAGPASAQTSACPAADPTYTGNCGPTFVLPGWGDAGGWSDPSQYSTIQLADVDGDGRDELLGRGDAGIQVHVFDTTLGQWRPQIGANGLPQVLNGFRSALPSETPVWEDPEHYTTIQTADIDGKPGEELLARAADGFVVYRYQPGAGGGPGSWAQIGTDGPFSDADGYGSDPSLYTTIQAADLNGDKVAELFGRDVAGIAAYSWNGSGWTALPSLTPEASNTDLGEYPQYYSDIVAGDVDGKAGDEVLTRNLLGVHTAALARGSWGVLDGAITFSAFADYPPTSDCPINPTECLGWSPSYYETMQLADVDGQPGAELLGRLTDGLRVKHWGGAGTGWTQNPLTTLTDLAGPAPTVAEGTYGSIQTANLDGVGGREVLALDGTALQAWSYASSTQAWTKLAPSQPLALGSDPWLTDPSTFSTIQTGDVDGNGRDEVIARGPYGVRTWFYNRRGTGGWERYLPAGYPAFASAGEQAAFAELNIQAQARGVIPSTDQTVRDVWSAENAPQDSDLSQLQQGLVLLAACSNPNPGDPPSYMTCTPPAGSSGFTPTDWTNVVNEILAEIFWARQVLAHFTQVDRMRQSLFIAEGAELPAIGSDLQLQGAANNSASFDLQDNFADAVEIMGAIAGVESGPLGAILAITGEVISMLPSSSDTTTGTFEGTYSGLQSQFAKSVSGLDKALSAQSQTVRQDLALTTLVGRLRAGGTWSLDEVGAGSAASQGFAQWVYETLVPTVYSRYDITLCEPNGAGDAQECEGPSSGTGVIDGGENFVALGLPPVGHFQNTPCNSEPVRGKPPFVYCDYTGIPPSSLRTLIWGDVSPQCSYQPGNANTAWTFGCSVGVSADASMGARHRWPFNSFTGSPATWPIGAVRPPTGSLRASGAGRAVLRIGARARVPRVLDLRRVSVSVRRLLHEPGGLGELIRRPAARRPGAAAPQRRLTRIRLTRRGRGRARAARFASRRARGPKVRLLLRRRGRARLSLVLRVRRGQMPVAPAACNALPAAVHRSPDPVQLHTRVRIRVPGGRPIVLSLRPHWRCRRGRDGAIRRLSVVRPRRLERHRGLAITARGPRSAPAGARVRFRFTVRNRRSTRFRDRLHASFWNGIVRAGPGRRGGPFIRRFRELRRNRHRTYKLALRVPRSGSKRVCAAAVVTAEAARPARTRVCTRVRG